MKKSDFLKHQIINFKYGEITGTGAMLSDVKLNLMVALQLFRSLIRRRVGLIYHGMTTGTHSAVWHPYGLAVDFYLYPDDGPVKLDAVFKAALSAGFKGIGIYWKGIKYSFHLDLRPDFVFWSAHKDVLHGVKEWEYLPLLVDPAKLGETAGRRA